MVRDKKMLLSFASVLLILLIAFLVFLPYKQVIAFTFEDGEQLLAYMSINEEKTFQIQYTHSIHLSDVIETYLIRDHQIILTELSYQDFAVGMPSNAEGDEIFEMKDSTYYIKNMNRAFDSIDLLTGQVRANHRINYQNKTMELANSIEPGTWIRISEKRISLWQQLKGVNING